MVGVLDHEFYVAGLDHRAAIQHDDVVADLIGRRQIVGDVDEGNAVFQVHGAQCAKDSGAEGRVHHRHGFVGYDGARRSSGARATMTRWRCPPLSWCGKRPRVSSGRSPTACSTSAIKARAAALERRV